MSIVPTLRQLGKHTQAMDRSGVRYTLRYFVPVAQIDLFRLKFGAEIGAPSESFPHDLPTPPPIIGWGTNGVVTMGQSTYATVLSRQEVAVADDGYIVTLVCGSTYYGSSLRGSQKKFANNFKDVEVNWGKADVKCLPSFWGLRQASNTDKDTAIKTRLRTSSASGIACNVGDYLQPDATSSTVGLCDFSQCPFGTTSTTPFTSVANPEIFDWVDANASTPTYLNTNIPTDTFKIKYVSTVGEGLKDLKVGFFGINPAGFVGVPARIKNAMPDKDKDNVPLDYEGIWRSVSQDVKPHVVNGEKRYMVTRVIQRAPKFGTLQTRWLKEKNGGIWKW
jgi:hypothetical protein